MSDKKPATPATNPTQELLRALGIPPGAGRRLVPWLLGMALLGGALAALWRFVEPHIVAGPHYTLDPRHIALSPLPGWIKTDVRGEALRNAGLDGPLSMLDPQLAERLYKAFELHPWVAKVDRVAKLSPDRVEVVLQYRRPVCMVEVPGGLFPVDAQAVLLPSADFSPLEAQRYPRLSGIQTVTEGPVGAQWRDAHVQGAARLAAVLLEGWTELGLERITPAAAAAPAASSAAAQYEVYTKAGARILWGCAPGESAAGEPPPEEKLARLRNYVRQRGSLDGPQEIDLRQAPAGAAPRTAARP